MVTITEGDNALSSIPSWRCVPALKKLWLFVAFVVVCLTSAGHSPLHSLLIFVTLDSFSTHPPLRQHHHHQTTGSLSSHHMSLVESSDLEGEGIIITPPDGIYENVIFWCHGLGPSHFSTAPLTVLFPLRRHSTWMG
jgi:hypothetical protein